MLQNRIIVTSKNDKNEIYKLSKNKWIIELDGNKIISWYDFYDIIQKEIDIVDYHSKFGRKYHTFADFSGDIELFKEVQKRKVDGIILILTYTENFKKVLTKEKENIYYCIILKMLLEWYRDLKIIYNQEKPTINIEMYILLEEEIKEFTNELIIAIEDDRKEIYKEYGDYKIVELKVEFELNGHLSEILKKEIKNDSLIYEILREEENEKFINKFNKKLDINYSKLKLLISNSDKLRDYHDYILFYIVENVLIQKYKNNEEIKIYMIFSNEIC